MQPSELRPITARELAALKPATPIGTTRLFTAEQMADALESAMDSVCDTNMMAISAYKTMMSWRDMIKELRLKE
jgi:hypothetical protein